MACTPCLTTFRGGVNLILCEGFFYGADIPRVFLHQGNLNGLPMI